MNTTTPAYGQTGSDRTGQAQLWDKCAESAGLPRGVPGLPEAVIARAARRAPTSAPSRFTRSVACQPGPSESTKSPAGRGCRLSTAEHGNVRLLGSDSHATRPCCASELLTSLVDAGIQYSNIYAAVRLDVLRKCCLLRCVARDITLHGPGGAAGACSKPCCRLCCGQVHVCCLPFTRKGKPEYTSSAACARPSALLGRCFAQGSKLGGVMNTCRYSAASPHEFQDQLAPDARARASDDGGLASIAHGCQHVGSL